MPKINSVIETLTWKEARKQVFAVNKPLAKVIDEIDPSNKYKLIKASYSYGDLIVQNGETYLPTSPDEIVPISSNKIDSKLQAQLNYNSIPLALIINKSCEVFVGANDMAPEPCYRVVPLNSVNAGSMFGTFETMNYLTNRKSSSIWNVSAGARTIFMLPRVADNVGLRKLRLQYKIPSTMRIQHASDHWQVFKTITKHKKLKQDWKCEVLFFTKDWLELKNSRAWESLRRHFYKEAWLQSQYAIEKISFGLAWQTFINAISSRNLRPRPYLADTVKHLFLIGTGTAPAIVPANSKQTDIAPISDIQQAFIETYLLKRYSPTIMYSPALDTPNKQLPLYYSLAHPTLLEGSPQNSRSSTIMLDLKDIKELIDTLKDRAGDMPNNIFTKWVNFDYFHTNSEMYDDIQSSVDIPNKDMRFLEDKKQFPDRDFCSKSLFWRGCIRITPNGLKND